MANLNIVNSMMKFIDDSPTAYHAIDNIKKELSRNGFTELSESAEWNIERGKGYFVTKNLSSIIAFKVPNNTVTGFNIVASHSDSPCFVIKERHELEGSGCVRLNTEKYGGPIISTWLDRPLSIAGRLIICEGGKISAKLVNIDRDLLMIPNAPIHMLPDLNNGYKYNVRVDMTPILGDDSAKGKLLSMVAENASVSAESIISFDLIVYNRQKAVLWGANNEFVACSRLDNLECAYLSTVGLLGAKVSTALPVLAVFDNEEVGSGTKQGAASTFLFDTLERVHKCLSKTDASTPEFKRLLGSGFMVSADNAHAVHPAHPELYDSQNKVFMNKGVVIKYNASQRYTTDAVSSAIFKKICENAEVPYQVYANRSDIAGGGTLGSISSSQVSIYSVDIGLAQLAMHSSYECGGTKDIVYMEKVLRKFYETPIKIPCDGEFCIG